jgi:hypothetical protein
MSYIILITGYLVNLYFYTSTVSRIIVFTISFKIPVFKALSGRLDKGGLNLYYSDVLTD